MTTTDLAARDVSDLVASPYTPIGLILRDGLPFREWELLGATLSTMERGINWWIGDWLRYGEREYGERYAQAIQETGRGYQSLANLQWVASRIEFSRRRENLTWSHHAEVAALDPDAQDRLLDRAEQERWSVRALREAVQAERKAIPAPKEEPPAETPARDDTVSAYSEAEEDDRISDLVASLEEADARLRRQEAELQSLRADEHGQEIARLHDRVSRLEARLQGQQNTIKEQERIIRWQKKILDGAAKLLGVTSHSEITSAIKDLLS